MKINEVSREEEGCVDRGLSEIVIDISSYDVVRELGSGGFGKVFLCEKGSSVVAAKFIDCLDDLCQESFEREIVNLKSLSHPFIVSLVGFSLPCSRTNNKFVIAMEYVAGGSLSEVLCDRPSWFDNTSRIEIICSIAIGMSFVHSNGIIHRDLKPANVLLDSNHVARICDFGSSRLMSVDGTLTTRPNVTPVYAAPEVYDGEYSSKIDVYSFGVIVYEVVTGNRAFRNMTPMQLMKHVGLGKREPIPDSVSPFAKYLIEVCWSQDPSSRPSFSDICGLLRKNMHLLFSLDTDFERLWEFRSKYFK